MYFLYLLLNEFRIQIHAQVLAERYETIRQVAFYWKIYARSISNQICKVKVTVHIGLRRQTQPALSN